MSNAQREYAPYFRLTLGGVTVELRASAPLTKEHLALLNDYLETYEESLTVAERCAIVGCEIPMPHTHDIQGPGKA